MTLSPFMCHEPFREVIVTEISNLQVSSSGVRLTFEVPQHNEPDAVFIFTGIRTCLTICSDKILYLAFN